MASTGQSAAGQDIPPAQKARTLEHMNKDHRADMRDILLFHSLSSQSSSPSISSSSLPPPPSKQPHSTHQPSARKTDQVHVKKEENEDEADGVNEEVEGDDDDDGDGDDLPLMVDISLESVTLRRPRAGTTHVVPFDPPLAAWAERRARLVEMTRRARAALGRPAGDDGVGVGTSGEDGQGQGQGQGRDARKMPAQVQVQVREYVPPRVPYDAAVFAAVLFYFACAALERAGLFDEARPAGGSGVAATRLPGRVVQTLRFPGGLAGFRWLVRAIFVPVLAIHLAEMVWFERTRLSRFGVRRGSRVWWLWLGSVFIEGVMAFKRFDFVVERARREQARKAR